MRPIVRILTAFSLAGLRLHGAELTVPEKLIEAGHWKRARVIVESRLREAPSDPLANFLTSQIRAAFGDRNTPLQFAEKAVSLEPGTAKYHRQVAEILGFVAQKSNSLQQLLLSRRFRREIDSALTLDPRDAQALRDLMEFYILAPGIIGGDSDKARETADRIVAVDPVSGALARSRLAVFHNKPREARSVLEHAPEFGPSSYLIRTALADLCLSAEPPDLSAAEFHSSEALKLDRNRVQAWTLLARAQTLRARWADLDTTLADASIAVPDDPSPWFRAADEILLHGSDPSRAERYLRTYLSQPPEGNAPVAADARWKLGLALQRQGRIAEATAEWKEAVRLDPSSPAARELKSQSR